MLKKTLAALVLGSALVGGHSPPITPSTSKASTPSSTSRSATSVTAGCGAPSGMAGFSFDAAKPEQSKVNVTLETASVDTNHAERDRHLRSDDFSSQAPDGHLRIDIGEVHG